MPDSPLSASPYEVLGVPVDADDDALRRAYRRRLRETHPDTGGRADEFHAVQAAWDLVGTPEDRARYDRGRRPSYDDEPTSYAPRTHERRETRPQARSHGHPGGWMRLRYLELIREWAGRGNELDDPFAAKVVQAAPRELRLLLADALAEEATAAQIADLGIAYTAWHDVVVEQRGFTGGFAAGGDGLGPASAAKIDHVVLGPSGLFAIASQDWGAPVKLKRGELISEGLAAGETPFATLAQRAKALGRAARVRVSGVLIVVPDGASSEGVLDAGKHKGMAAALVQRPRLPHLLRIGVLGAPAIGGQELFEVRTRLQEVVRFVE